MAGTPAAAAARAACRKSRAARRSRRRSRSSRASSHRLDLGDLEVRTDHAEAHRLLVDRALDLRLHAVLGAVDRTDQLVLLAAVGLQHPVSALEIAAADRALDLHVCTIAGRAARGQSATGG